MSSMWATHFYEVNCQGMRCGHSPLGWLQLVYCPHPPPPHSPTWHAACAVGQHSAHCLRNDDEALPLSQQPIRSQAHWGDVTHRPPVFEAGGRQKHSDDNGGRRHCFSAKPPRPGLHPPLLPVVWPPSTLSPLFSPPAPPANPQLPSLPPHLSPKCPSLLPLA